MTCSRFRVIGARLPMLAAFLWQVASAGPAKAASFDELHQKVSASPATQPESVILELLTAGLEEGRSVPAAAAAAKWLQQNQPQDAILLNHAARATELGGDWKGAVALYRQYLAKADLESAAADEAVYATYVLLLERLKDENGAYAFGRNDGGRLLVCPRARQFDRWFLDQAIARNDATAVAERLNACIAAGLPEDLLVASYGKYFRWLLGALDGYCDHGMPVTQDLYDAVKDLCDVITHDEEMKLRLDWAVSVKAYNVAKIGDKAKSRVIKRPPGKIKGPKPNTATAKGQSKNEAGKKAADARAAEAQKVEEKKLELGDEVTPPIAEAEALLAKYPRYALWVMTGWAGGGNGPYYRSDPKLYWPHEADAKFAPILAVLSKLPPAEAAEILNAVAYGGYVSNPGVLELRAVRDYLRATPDLWKFRNSVVILPREWNQMSQEEAQNLAPRLAPIANPLASMVRAIAAGGKDFDKVMAAFLGPEVWRLGPNELNGGWADQLWHYCGRPGGNQKRDEWIAKSKAVAASFAAGDAKKEDPADKRIATFRNLWADYKSAQPKIPAVRSRAVAVLRITPEVLPELLKDPSLDAQSLVRDALAAGMEDSKGPLGRDGRVNNVNSVSYDPWINRLAAATYGGMDRLKPDKDRYKPHPLEPIFRAGIAEGLKQNRIDSWLVMAWINVLFPEDNAEQVKLMQAMFKSQAWASVPFEVKYGAREWFMKVAMTPGQIAWIDAADPAIVCKDLLSLTNTADTATTVAALSAAVTGVNRSPVKIAIQGLDRLAAATNTAFADARLQAQILEVTDGLRFACDRTAEPFGAQVLAHVSATPDPVVLHRVGAFLWSYGASEHYAQSLPRTLQLAQSLLETQPATAAALARTGLAVLNERVAEHPRNWAERSGGREALKALARQAAMKLGLMDLPVAQTDPAYPIYKSQVDWLAGNEESAWNLCEKNRAQLLPVLRELSIEYLMWVLRTAINTRDEILQESLVKAMMAWADEPNSVLNAETRADLEISYADIAVQRDMLKEAREILTRILQNKAYDGTPGQFKAALARVGVDRLAKDYDAALETLGELELHAVAERWTAIRFARAEVYFDMEDYNTAAEDVDTILVRNPSHADATILQGKLRIKRQRLMEATEVEVGSTSELPQLAPGAKLKVTLNDPGLAVSGAGTEIEVTVWAESGDRENIFLRQFGDQKTKFRGEVNTALGAPKPDDRVLQVIGDDKVYYGYSERFRRKMNNMEDKQGGPITVASDAFLMASARKLLSEAEQRLADMQAEMDKLQAKGISSETARGVAQTALAAKAERSVQEGMESAGLAARELESLQDRLQAETVKPGSPIHVRVVDPDRSRTAGVDEVVVSVESSSGDAVHRVVLKETGPYTGWFENRIQTAGAQAMASAANTEPGRNPNAVISPKAGYPAWRPVPMAGKTPALTIDLNDNVALGELVLTAAEPGAKLRMFMLQTGMMEKGGLHTVAVYPRNQLSVDNQWQPSLVVMNDTDQFHASGIPGGRTVYDVSQLSAHLERGWMTQQFAQGLATNVAGPTAAFPPWVPTAVNWSRNGQHEVSSVIYRFRGYFHEPVDVIRRFQLDLGKFEIPGNTHPSINHPPQFLLAVDGRPITLKDGPLDGKVELKPGVHSFEIWGVGWVRNLGFGRTVRLMTNQGFDPETLIECPDAFFDSTRFPAGVLGQRNGIATVTANPDGTEFTVRFAPGSRARLLSFHFLAQEGPVPAVSKVALTGPDGKRVLPVAEDFAELNKNEVLEVLAGDRVAVRYVDDRFVTKDKEKHERFLSAAFSNARMSFEYHEKRLDRDGEEVDYFESQLRFALGKPVLLTVMDPDMDETVSPDTVSVTLESKAGGTRKLLLRESGESTGIFRAQVTPVAGAPTAEGQVSVEDGDVIKAAYRDQENTDPGVPVDRLTTLSHARFAPPVLRLSHAMVTALPTNSLPRAEPLNEGFAPLYRLDKAFASMSYAARRAWEAGKGTVRPRWRFDREMRATSNPPAQGFETVSGRELECEVDAPFLALRVSSKVEVFAQTETGRTLAKQSAAEAPAPSGETPTPVSFDIRVPGTIRLEADLILSGVYIMDWWRVLPQIPIYQWGDLVRKDGQSVERFVCSVPLIAAAIPDHGVLSAEEIENRVKMGIPVADPGLAVRPKDTVHIGIRYVEPDGAERWVTASTRVVSHSVLDVLEEDYRNVKTNAFVGENLFLRVVDLGADASDRGDSVSVVLEAGSGAKHTLTLTEVDTHSGVFKGFCPLTYTKSGAAAGKGAEGYDVKAEGFPVTYGDVVTVGYTDAQGTACVARVAVKLGGDGAITPFSKRYDDPEMAMRTQFAMAESYLEVARNRRSAGNAAAAVIEFDAAKQLLANVVEQFREPETRAHAEYLLATLTQEEAESAPDAAAKESRYRAALSRFMNVTGTYPDTLHASRAQFKIATIFEKLKEPDVAAQEYVKLAYKHPDSEYLAVAMARLGTHFQRKAAEYEAQAKELLAKTDDKDAQFDGTARQIMAVREYRKSGSIFRRLLERFPSHELAGAGGLKAGQSYMRAGDNRQAVNLFTLVLDNEGFNGPDVRAQAMYWAGMCYEALREPMAAYSIYKRLTYDFPETTWASHGRAQLSQDGMLNLETDLEIKQLEGGK